MELDYVKCRLDQERRYLARDGEVVQVLPNVTRVVNGRERTVLWSGLDAGNADEIVAGDIEHHRAAKMGFEWKFYSHDKPDDLLARLQRRGLVAGPREAVMVYDLSVGELSAGGEDCVVRRITRAEEIEQYRLVAEEALRKNYSFTCGELAAGLASGSTQQLGYVASIGDEPVSIGRLYTHPMSVFGGLYGGTTREAYRGRGFYRAVVAARAKDAVNLGAKYLIVDALPTSRPILERLGFVHLTDTVPCEWRA